jgi:hypothetical protein
MWAGVAGGFCAMSSWVRHWRPQRGVRARGNSTREDMLDSSDILATSMSYQEFRMRLHVGTGMGLAHSHMQGCAVTLVGYRSF